MFIPHSLSNFLETDRSDDDGGDEEIARGNNDDNNNKSTLRQKNKRSLRSCIAQHQASSAMWRCEVFAREEYLTERLFE